MTTDKKNGEDNVIDLETGEAAEATAPADDALAIATKKAEAAQKDLLYAKAEFENQKRRLIKEQDMAIKFANQQIATELMNVVDYFDKAIFHSKALKEKADKDTKNFISGIEMTHHELLQLLGRFGVEFVGKVGEKFDPEKHEAVSQVEVPADKDDTVVELVQRGSSQHGRLLKPARVVVGKAAE